MTLLTKSEEMLEMRGIAAFMLALTLICTAGCVGWRASATRTEQYTAPVPTEVIVVEGRNGNIRVQTGDFKEVIVDANLKAYGVSEDSAMANLDEINVRLEESAGSLRIFAEYPDGFRGGVGFVVKTPPAVSVDLQTGNGPVDVDGVLRNVRARTSNGRVTVTKAVGPVEVQTSNGSVEIETLEPTHVVAETSNGRIGFRGMLAGDGNRLETSNGRVEVYLTGEPVQISYKTSNGSVTFDAEKQGREGKRVVGGDQQSATNQLRVKTSNGSISVISNIESE